MLINRQTGITLLFLQLLLAFPDTVQAQTVSQEDEVREAVAAFGRAYSEADVSYLQSRLTKAYIHVNGSSGNVLSREEWLSWVQSRRAKLVSGELIINTYTIDDLLVEIYAQTAVVTGVVGTHGIQASVPFTSGVRFTNTWVKQDGVWLRAMFHDSDMSKGS